MQQIRATLLLIEREAGACIVRFAAFNRRIPALYAPLRDGADLGACKRAYFEACPDGPEREKWPDIAYVRVRPRWIRFSDFGQTPARIEELNLAS